MNSKLILLVEDSEADTLLFRRAAQTAGLINPVHSIRSGAEVLRYLSGEDEYADRQRYPFPSVVFFDVDLPAGDGFEVLARIRADFPREQLLLVVLSSSFNPTVVRRASLLRADAFLPKPPRPVDLKNLAEQLSSYF